ncbi:E3 ubiquitin-protein ligase synoviolin-like [Branchiostoma floridae]|uniref:RING-type E3 ubiquitin transferase n=1 Tax=Branchiostoma floridae TaxID=7739 RepID=A0A9J7MBM7_BRAFL|nr:E3 ubiquitin-protein ligase synoviolin-like [Branchiostoma floridae]
MRAVVLTLGSLCLTAAVIGNAYYQKQQFYPSVVYLTKSNPSMAVLYIQAFVIVILMGKLVRKLFFGQLRAAEMEHLIERSWYAVTETCLAFTVFRDDFSPRFVALFTFLLFLKCFHWLAEDRVDYMERSPVISWLFHIRVISLLLVLGCLDAMFISHAYHSTLIRGATVQLVFGFEYAILLTMVITTFVKYILHTIDLQSENPWDNKAVYLLYTELTMGFVKVLLYMAFMIIMIKVHTFPLFAIRPMYLTVRAFKKAVNDVIMSRRAIRNMNTLYPDATPEELAQADNVCIICREEMVTASKKLPCNHIFHTSCLRSWFQRQQTCPTCRMDVLRAPPPQQNATPQPPPAPQPPQQIPPVFPGFPMWPPPHVHPGQVPQVPPQTPPSAGTSQAAASTTAATQPAAAAPGSTAPAMTSVPPGSPLPTVAGLPPFPPAPPHGAPMPGLPPPFMMPPGFFVPPPFVPPPMPSPNYSGMTEEELRAMEGQERQHLVARVECLRSIQTLLDAAMVQMQQYTSLMATLGTPVAATTAGQGSSPVPTATTTQPADTTEVTSVLSSKMSPREETPSSPGQKPAVEESGQSQEESGDLSELEGAVGFTPQTETLIPEDTEVPPETDANEIRRRRIERLSSQPGEEEETEP